jgi:hypothetical protein
MIGVDKLKVIANILPAFYQILVRIAPCVWLEGIDNKTANRLTPVVLNHIGQLIPEP